MSLTPCLVTNTGSIPVGATKSKYGKFRRRYKKSNNNTSVFFLMPSWRFRLVARTHASHAWNTGSIPVGATKKANTVNSVGATKKSNVVKGLPQVF